MGGNLSYPAVDLAGKVALVTGANTGIGYETAKALAVMGAHTFVACRSKQKAEACVERMKTELGTEMAGREVTVETVELDLASFRSTRGCADAFKAKNLPLHLLVNNAGVGFFDELTKTEDGNELEFQVNHLSPLLLTLELLPTLVETASTAGDCRVVWVASKAHNKGRWDPHNLNGELSYSNTGFYSNSKLYNVMTAYNMQRRLHQTGITVSCLHPGVIKSELWRHMTGSRNITYSLFAKVGTHFMRSVKEGAATTINCAVNPALNSQQCFYYADCAPKQPTAIARSEQYQEELWDISLKILGQYLSPDVLEKYGVSKLASSSSAEAEPPQPTTVAAASSTEQERESPSTTAKEPDPSTTAMEPDPSTTATEPDPSTTATEPDPSTTAEGTEPPITVEETESPTSPEKMESPNTEPEEPEPSVEGTEASATAEDMQPSAMEEKSKI